MVNRHTVTTGSALRLALVAAVALIVGGCAAIAPTPGPTATPVATPTSASAGSPTAAPTFTPRTTFIAKAAHDGALAMTVTLAASGWRWDDIARGFVKGTDANDVPEASVLLWSWPAGTGFYVYGDPCRWASTRPNEPATTADEIVAGLAAQASRGPSEPVDVSIGGHAGKSITLHVPDDAVFDQCDSSQYASYGVTGDEPARYHQGPGQIDEFWFVEVDGAFAVFDATYRPDTPTQLVEEMRGIALSATFEAP